MYHYALDTSIWSNVINKFIDSNNYYVLEEVPGWVRAVDPAVKDFRLVRDEHRQVYGVAYFSDTEDYTAFLLRWA